jgi:hypothetical protein
MAQQNKYSLMHVLNYIYQWFDYWNFSGSSGEIATGGTHDWHLNNKKFSEELIAYFPRRQRASGGQFTTFWVFDPIRTSSKHTSSNISSIVAYVSWGVLPSNTSQYLLLLRGNMFTEPLPSTKRARWSHKPPLFVQNKESKLKRLMDS